MLEIREKNRFCILKSAILFLGFFFVYSPIVFEINEISTLQRISALKVFGGNVTGIQHSEVKEELISGIAEESYERFQEVELEKAYPSFEVAKETVSHSPVNISKTILKPIVDLSIVELSRIYNYVESEYKSISSVSVVDDIEDCVNTRKSLNDILDLMLKTKELLIHERKQDVSPVNSDKRNKDKGWFKGKERFNSNKNVKYPDLFFYVQTNISIIKNTISLYNLQYKVFTTQEQILGGMSKLMSDISALILSYKENGIKRKNTIEKQISELNKKVSRIVSDYSSILRRVHLFTSMRFYSNYSKNIQHYIQVIPCRLKYRLQNSMFDDLINKIDLKTEQTCS
ncbi:hypothetical protein FG386_001426 [Cryptosporidium ryanae]|uniref:uncharacterized protein n=1 Tax=Cryptosporidium ryanae TaxID=515981 RepID=UPI00351A1ACF|nr:hypothetical protein FG386_001426 [Cryptosporidium ryanae]